jgi:hypothetical protein
MCTLVKNWYHEKPMLVFRFLPYTAPLYLCTFLHYVNYRLERSNSSDSVTVMSEGNWLFLFTSAGGLGDVVGSLPKALSCHSHNITVTAILCRHPRQKGLVQIECHEYIAHEYIAKKNTRSQNCSSEADNPITWSSSDNQNCVLHIVWRVQSTAHIL